MKKLCVIFGGPSAEHDISIITGMQLAKNVKGKIQLEKIYYSLDGDFYFATKVNELDYFKNKNEIKLKKLYFSNGAVYTKSKLSRKLFDVECVINCCHGGPGENGDLASYFEINKIPYTSANPLSAQIGMDKELAKSLVDDIVSTVPSVRVKKDDFKKSCAVIEKLLTDELIVKPNSLGSSIGVKACTKNDYIDQINAIFLMGDDALVENRILNMDEYNQACFFDGTKLVTSAIEKPITKSDFLSFKDKYDTNSKEKGGGRELPAKIGAELQKNITKTTKEIYSRLKMNGVVRIDYIFDKDKEVLYFNEINTIPGSMAFYLYEPVGIDYITLIERLIENTNSPKEYKYFDTDILGKKSI